MSHVWYYIGNIIEKNKKKNGKWRGTIVQTVAKETNESLWSEREREKVIVWKENYARKENEG